MDRQHRTLNEQRLAESAAARQQHFNELCRLPGYRFGFERYMAEGNANAILAERERTNGSMRLARLS